MRVTGYCTSHLGLQVFDPDGTLIGIIDKPPTGKASRSKVQQAYNQWQQESGLGLTELSRILALSIDAPKD